RGRDGETEATGRKETEGEREGLVVGEHQGRKFEAGAQSVGAMAAALRFDGDAEVLENRHVAADGPLIDVEALGGCGSAEAWARLEEFEGGQDAGGWVVHRGSNVRGSRFGVRGGGAG